MGPINWIKSRLARPSLKEPAIINVQEHCADGWCRHVEHTEILVENINAPYALQYATATHTVQNRCKKCGTLLRIVIVNNERNLKSE